MGTKFQLELPPGLAVIGAREAVRWCVRHHVHDRRVGRALWWIGVDDGTLPAPIAAVDWDPMVHGVEAKKRRVTPCNVT